jgi:threonine dehydratase
MTDALRSDALRADARADLPRADVPQADALPGDTPPNAATAIDAPMIEAAARRIGGHVRRTPTLVVDCDGLAVDFKLEFLQASGTFKARGAFNRLLAAREAGTLERVVAASGGNHGIAVAHAAAALGVPADVFVPEPTPSAKVERLVALGATVHRQGSAYPEALAASHAFASARGALVSHAYDQPETVAGQGTVAREWQRQSPQLDAVLVAVGGGGLIGGIAAWYGARAAAGDRPVRVVAVEPQTCATLHAALAAGRIVDVDASGSAVDSLGARRVGDLMFPIAQRHVAEAVLVTDAAIAHAQAWLWQRLRVAVEPGGAAALAALLSGAWRPAPGERVGVLLCGANVDLGQLAATVRACR